MQENEKLHSDIVFLHTSMDWLQYCREISMLILQDADHEMIGGPIKVVKIDESKFGK